MELEGKIRKHSKGGPPDWIVEIPTIGLVTEGRTRQEAIKMLKGAIVDYINYYFEHEDRKGLKIIVTEYGRTKLGIECSSVSLLTSLVLIKQRELSGVTIREAAKKVGSDSPNAYKKYEYGRISPSIDKLEQLFHLVNPSIKLTLRI